ncbi:MAG: DUF4381 family protein [Halopseudomonas sp.]|uniref:DUF4381 family protein n=1 Tax=Halopseudomonas sp. TaxID=2901191 RepID=UPI0030024D92
MSSPLQDALIQPAPPPPIPWWPPASGWIALAVILVLLLIAIPLFWLALRRRQRRRQRAQRIIWEVPDQLPDQAWLAALNTQLKRQLKSRGELHATRLFGSAWVDYLCQSYPHPQAKVLQPLGKGLYEPGEPLSSLERLALQRELLRWIRHNHV